MIVVLNLFDLIPGQEAVYAEYLRRVQSLLERHRARVLCYGQTRARFMEGQSQEYCGIIAYESPEDLCRFSRDPEFAEIRALRDRSTTNYALTVVEQVGIEETARILAGEAQRTEK